MKVTLKSQDDQTFTVDKQVAERSVLLKNMLEDVGESEAPIPLPNVTGRVLKRVELPFKIIIKKHQRTHIFSLKMVKKGY